MKKFFNGITWLTAIAFAVLFTFMQFGLAVAFDDEGRLTLFWIVASIIISILSQLGLFLAPWSENFKKGYQLLIIVMMLPSLWGIGSELANVVGLTALVAEPEKHIEEIAVLSGVMAVYIGQISSVS